MINCWFVRKAFDMAVRTERSKMGRQKTEREIEEKKSFWNNEGKNTTEVAFSAQVNQRDQFVWDNLFSVRTKLGFVSNERISFQIKNVKM